MANIKQGNQLQMQVHEGYHVVDEALPKNVVENQAAARTGKKPLAHYSSLVRVLGSDMKTTEEPAPEVWRGWAYLTNSDPTSHCLSCNIRMVIKDLGKEAGEIALKAQDCEFDPQNPC